MNITKIFFAAVLSLLALSTVAAEQKSAVPTGDQHRKYFFKDANQTMPYRLYVPTTYDGSKTYPLLVLLHGGGSDENLVFDATKVRELAEQRGLIVVAPLGYNTFGGYGDIYPVVVTRETGAAAPELLKRSSQTAAAPATPRPKSPEKPATKDDYFELPASWVVDPRNGELSEKDVMNVLAIVQGEYRVDASRIYLAGNSMGGIGTLYLAAKYPQIWAAIAPAGGPVAAWSYPFARLREQKIAALFVHGELDEHSNAHWSQVLVERAKAEGVDANLLLVKGASHVLAWREALPQTLDFLLKHSKPAH